MKRKGFTLVELLAVIVILSIILLIAVPAVKKSVDSAKKKSAENDARMIKNIAEKYYTSNLDKDEEITGIDLSSDTLTYSGEKPTKGYLYFTEDGIAYGKMYVSGYCVEIASDGTSTSEKTKESECNLSNSDGTITITLNANGGTLSQNKLTLKSGDTYGELPTPTKSGYVFLGWYTNDNTKIESTTKVPQYHITLIAKYEKENLELAVTDEVISTADGTHLKIHANVTANTAIKNMQMYIDDELVGTGEFDECISFLKASSYKIVLENASGETKTYTGVHPSIGTCFTENTIIKTNNDEKYIQDIKINDVIKSYNFDTKKMEDKKVLKTFVNTSSDMIKIYFKSGSVIESTLAHPYHVLKKGFVSASKLKIGDKITAMNGTDIVIKTEKLHYEEPIKIYNFEVSENHNYYVGTNGLLVHNASSIPVYNFACYKDSKIVFYK